MKNTKKLLCLFLAVIMVLCSAPVTVIAAPAYSGDCGENLTWEIDADNMVLRINGTGEMPNYGLNEFGEPNAPWLEHKSLIKTVEITSGVTSICDYAFYKCEYLTKITIPDSVTKIGESAFAETDYYKDVNNWSDGILYINN